MVSPHYLNVWLPSSQNSKDHTDYTLVSSGHLVLFAGLLCAEILKYNANLVYRAQKQFGHEHECKMTHKCAACACVCLCLRMYRRAISLPQTHTRHWVQFSPRIALSVGRKTWMGEAVPTPLTAGGPPSPAQFTEHPQILTSLLPNCRPRGKPLTNLLCWI